MDYLRTIRLGYGKGEPGKQACWMTALQSHVGGEWTDRCDCVDVPINTLCIAINDLYGIDDDARTDDILNFGLFAPLGTLWNEQTTVKRAFVLIDAVIRRWLPFFFDKASAFRSLQEITDNSTFYSAVSAVRQAGFLLPGVYLDKSSAGCRCLCDTAWALANNMLLGLSGRREFIQKELFPVLQKMIEAGPHAPKEYAPVAIDETKFCQLVGIKR